MASNSAFHSYPSCFNIGYCMNIVYYYIPSRNMPKISPYFSDQIKLDGLKTPYYPSTVCNGKRQYLVQKNEPCALFFRFEMRLMTSILRCFRFETRFMTSFARLYQRNVIFASIQIHYAVHMQFICRYAQFGCLKALTYKLVRANSAIIFLITGI